MDKKKKVIPKYVFDEKLYEVAKAVLPVLYEKVDLKYMDKDNIYMHTSYTAISFAESFMKEFGYVTDEMVKEGKSPANEDPIMSFDQESNVTKIDLNQLKLKKTSDKK